MRTTIKRGIPIAVATLALGGLAMGPALAANSDTFRANLTPLNGSGASGTATVVLTGNSAKVTIKSSGLLKGMPHAQHIHIGGKGTCPSASKKGTGVKGHLTTSDGQPDYGMVKVSLTSSGDTSGKSALAVDRFTAGNATYSRTITLDSKTVSAIKSGKASIVRHGLDYNGDGKYSGSAKSDLDPSLPEEATDPALCGTLKASQMSATPSGGVQTGGGSTSGIEDTGLIGLGAALVAGGIAFSARRRRSDVATRV